MLPREFYRTEGKPIEGQSHWCEGYTRWVLRHKCNNIVSNDSDHCAAGHRNKIRQSYPSTKSLISGSLLQKLQPSGARFCC